MRPAHGHIAAGAWCPAPTSIAARSTAVPPHPAVAGRWVRAAQNLPLIPAPPLNKRSLDISPQASLALGRSPTAPSPRLLGTRRSQVRSALQAKDGRRSNHPGHRCCVRPSGRRLGNLAVPAWPGSTVTDRGPARGPPFTAAAGKPSTFPHTALVPPRTRAWPAVHGGGPQAINLLRHSIGSAAGDRAPNSTVLRERSPADWLRPTPVLANRPAHRSSPITRQRWPPWPPLGRIRPFRSSSRPKWPSCLALLLSTAQGTVYPSIRQSLAAHARVSLRLPARTPARPTAHPLP